MKKLLHLMLEALFVFSLAACGGGGGGSVSGQFYGGSTDLKAAEAVGNFSYGSGTNGVSGAFGVKK